MWALAIVMILGLIGLSCVTNRLWNQAGQKYDDLQAQKAYVYTCAALIFAAYLVCTVIVSIYIIN